MSATYDKIIKCLNKTRRDYLFPPSDLNKLDNDERKNVEERIIKLCLLGDRACFQYIDYLVMFKPQDVFNDDTLKDVSVTKRAFIYKRLYYLTKDYSYIVELYELAKKDINAYSILTLMYYDGDIDREDMYPSLLRLSTISEEYKMMFEKRCKKDSENVINHI